MKGCTVKQRCIQKQIHRLVSYNLLILVKVKELGTISLRHSQYKVDVILFPLQVQNHTNLHAYYQLVYFLASNLDEKIHFCVDVLEIERVETIYS